MKMTLAGIVNIDEGDLIFSSKSNMEKYRRAAVDRLLAAAQRRNFVRSSWRHYRTKLFWHIKY